MVDCWKFLLFIVSACFGLSDGFPRPCLGMADLEGGESRLVSAFPMVSLGLVLGWLTLKGMELRCGDAVRPRVGGDGLRVREDIRLQQSLQTNILDIPEPCFADTFLP